MRDLRIKIADCVIQINTAYRLLSTFFADFLTDETPDIYISLNDADITDVTEIFNNKKKRIGWEGTIELSTVLERITDELINYNTFLLHGAAINVGTWGGVFSAPSGTGKTTHILKWLECCPETKVINGDKPFIKFNSNYIPFIYGSPWSGKESMFSNVVVPLKAIVFLERAENNSIQEISFAEALPRLYQNVYRPQDINKARMIISLLKQLPLNVSFYLFRVNNYKEDAFQIAYDMLLGQKSTSNISSEKGNELGI